MFRLNAVNRACCVKFFYIPFFPSIIMIKPNAIYAGVSLKIMKIGAVVKM